MVLRRSASIFLTCERHTLAFSKHWYRFESPCWSWMIWMHKHAYIVGTGTFWVKTAHKPVWRSDDLRVIVSSILNTRYLLSWRTQVHIILKISLRSTRWISRTFISFRARWGAFDELDRPYLLFLWFLHRLLFSIMANLASGLSYLSLSLLETAGLLWL
jgi:hypothetical protein